MGMAARSKSICDERLTGGGDAGYRGCQTKTRNGRTCQKWSSQAPHTHSRTPSKYTGKGLGDHNFCRNPDGADTIWCYTTDPAVRYEYCDPLPMPPCTQTNVCQGIMDREWRQWQPKFLTVWNSGDGEWEQECFLDHGWVPMKFRYRGSGLGDYEIH